MSIQPSLNRGIIREREREARRRERAELTRIARRHTQGEWPIDATTLEKADLEPGDVRTPLPPEPPPLSAYRVVAESPSFSERDEPGWDEDRNLRIARWYERQRERQRAEALRGVMWTVPLVDERLALAFEVVARERSRWGPRQFGSTMPRPVPDMGDLVACAENQSLLKLLSRMLRHRVVYSGEDVRRANEAIAWVAEYLADETDPEVPLFVNAGALWRATSVKVRHACVIYGFEVSTFYRKRKAGLECIVDGLIADRRAPL